MNDQTYQEFVEGEEGKAEIYEAHLEELLAEYMQRLDAVEDLQIRAILGGAPR